MKREVQKEKYWRPNGVQVKDSRAIFGAAQVGIHL